MKIKKVKTGVPVVAQRKWIWLVSMRTWVRSLASLSGLKGSGVAMSCGVGRWCSSDLAPLWLWRRPEATALIWPLAWELLQVWLSKKKKKVKTGGVRSHKHLWGTNISLQCFISSLLNRRPHHVLNARWGRMLTRGALPATGEKSRKCH